MEKDKIVIIVVFVLYILSMVGVGIFFNRRTKTNSDYVLGGRGLNPWVTALSAQASDMSGWLLTGLPGLAFMAVVGGKSAFYTALGLFIGTFLNWVLVAKRLRVYTEVAGNSITIPEYLKKRFDDEKGVISSIAALVFLIFFTVYTASMFSAGAKLFNSIFDIDYKYGILIGFFIIVSYTFLGGFKAVSWTDLFQGLLMFFALIIVPLIVTSKFNSSQSSELSEYTKAVFSLGTSPETKIPPMEVVTAIAWGLGYFGMPHILVRFMATKNKNTIKPATTVALIWVFISMAAAIFVGLVGHVYVKEAIDPESVFMVMVGNFFPPIIAGILLSAVLAAIMSTADSQLLVASSAFSTDIYKSLIKKDASDKHILIISKVTIVIVAIIAALIALNPNSSIFKLVQFAWGGFGAAFGPLILLSLYSKRITKKAALGGIIVGAATAIIFKYGLSRLGGFWSVYEILPGFILSAITIIVVSYIDKNGVTQKMNEEYDMYLQKLKEK